MKEANAYSDSVCMAMMISYYPTPPGRMCMHTWREEVEVGEKEEEEVSRGLGLYAYGQLRVLMGNFVAKFVRQSENSGRKLREIPSVCCAFPPEIVCKLQW